MRIKKIIATLLIILLLNGNVFALGVTMLACDNADCLSPAVQINFSTLQDYFEKLVDQNTLDNLINSNQISGKIDEQILTDALNKLIVRKDNQNIFKAKKPKNTFFLKYSDDTYTPMEVMFKWRWDKKNDTATDRAVVVIAEVIDIDHRENPFFNSVLSRGNYPRVMEMMFLIGKDGLNISHIDVRDVARKRGVATFMMEKMVSLADEFSNSKVNIVHIVNVEKISMMHEFVAKSGKGIEAADRHLLKYPGIYQKGKIRREVLAEFLGKDILLKWDIDQQIKRERYITSLANALEAMEKQGIKLIEQSELFELPIVKLMINAGCKNIKIAYSDYKAEVALEVNGSIVKEDFRAIVINSTTAKKSAKNISIDTLNNSVEISVKNTKKLRSYLKLPDEKELNSVIKFVEKQLEQNGVKKENIKGVYLMGSRLWSENAADWDMVICIDDQLFTKYTADAWAYNDTQIDFKIINTRDYEKERDLVFEILMKANITGRLVYGDNIIEDIIKDSKVSLEDILFTAEFSLNKSYGRTDVIDLYNRSKDSKIKDLFESEDQKETFFASLLSDVSGTIFSSMLVLRNILDLLELKNNFYSYDEIFKFWQRAKQKKMSYGEFQGYRSSVELAIAELKEEENLRQNFEIYMSNKSVKNGEKISLVDFKHNTLIRFLLSNNIKIDPDKRVPDSVELRNISIPETFTLKEKNGPGTGVYNIVLDGQVMPNSQIKIKQSAKAIIVEELYLSGAEDYSLGGQGRGTTILAYFLLHAIQKGKELILEQTQNYGLMHLSWKYLSSNARYFVKDNENLNDWSFEELSEMLTKDIVNVDISSPFEWSGRFELDQKGVFHLIDGYGDVSDDEILVQWGQNKEISVVMANEPLQKHSLKYKVETERNVEKIVISPSTLSQSFDPAWISILGNAAIFSNAECKKIQNLFTVNNSLNEAI